jgi:DNA-binding MarR family transcriptional regulator
MWPQNKEITMANDTCLCIGLRQAAHAMTAIYNEALAPSGLKITMFKVVRRLCEVGEPTISELAEIVDLDRSSLGRNLKVLERDGFVALGGGNDERSKVVRLTPKGKAALAKAKPLWRGVQRRMKAKLSKETDALLRTMSVMKAELGSGKAGAYTTEAATYYDRYSGDNSIERAKQLRNEVLQ